MLQHNFILSLLLFIVQGFMVTGENSPNNIIGSYWSPKKDARIEIYQKNQEYYGRFTWLETPRKDINNPVKALQSRDVLGLEFLSRFTFSQGIYSGGEIYDPETGKTYSCKMTLEGNKLKVRGYLGISLFGRTEIFEKIN